jgi:hypothetical protein
MFKSNTVFILGAGASKEAGLPTGAELREQIGRRLDLRFDPLAHGLPRSGDPAILAALREFAKDRQPPELRGRQQADINPYLREGHRIREAMVQAISIDNFIDAHPGNDALELIGKLAIARCILDAERKSEFFINQGQSQPRFLFENIVDTWYNGFFQLLHENVRHNAVERIFENVSFIDFNYDRCAPFFLFYSLQNYYGVAEGEAMELVNNLRTLHPYGVVGSLPFQDQKGGVEFGAEHLPPVKLLNIASQIKTFTEQTRDEGADEAIRTQIREADTIIFLGFGFHELNMALLESEKPGERAKRIFATAKGISNADVGVIRPQLTKLSQGLHESAFAPIIDNEVTCADLFAKYRRSLAQAR